MPPTTRPTPAAIRAMIRSRGAISRGGTRSSGVTAGPGAALSRSSGPVKCRPHCRNRVGERNLFLLTVAQVLQPHRAVFEVALAEARRRAQHDFTDVERKRVLQLMAQQAARMQALVGDLLTLAQLEGSPRPPP